MGDVLGNRTQIQRKNSNVETLSPFLRLFRSASRYTFKRSPHIPRRSEEIYFASTTLEDLPMDVLAVIFLVNLNFQILKNLSMVCKKFQNIIKKCNLWKIVAQESFPRKFEAPVEALLTDIHKDWAWVAGCVFISFPKKSRAKKPENSLKKKFINLYKKKDKKKIVGRGNVVINEEVLKRWAIVPGLSYDTKSKIFLRLMWDDKELSGKILKVLANCIEHASVTEIQGYFEIVTKILDHHWPNLRRNIEVFMKEILEVFERKKEREEILEWRECARKLQRLADHSVPLRRWLISNKTRWEWLPQYYTQTRAVANY